MQTADVLQPDVVFMKSGDFLRQISGEQPHQKIDFGFRPALPVFFGKSIESQRRNSNPRGALNRVADGSYARAMARHSRQMTLPRPAAIAVHDYGDVFWKPRWVEPPIYLSLFCVQPGRNCCLQGNPFVSEANIGETELQRTNGLLLCFESNDA